MNAPADDVPHPSESPDTASEVPPDKFLIAVFARADDFTEFSKLLQKELDWVHADATHAAHLIPGVLPGEHSRTDAERIATAIRKLGISARAIHRSDVPDFHVAPTVHHFRITPKGVEIIDRHDKLQSALLWSDVQLMNVGHVPLGSFHREIPREQTFIHSAAPIQSRSLDERTVSGPELWVVSDTSSEQAPNAAEPTSTGPSQDAGAARHPAAFRVEYNEFNYETLGTRLTSSTIDNFRTLLTELVAHAQRCYLTPTLREFVAGNPVHRYQFSSSSELCRNTEFHTLLVHELQSRVRHDS